MAMDSDYNDVYIPMDPDDIIMSSPPQDEDGNCGPSARASTLPQGPEAILEDWLHQRSMKAFQDSESESETDLEEVGDSEDNEDDDSDDNEHMYKLPEWDDELMPEDRL